MTALAKPRPNAGARPLHPIPVRIMHWLNAVAIIVMVMSGWGVYDDDAIFGWLFFPMWAKLGSWAANSLLWHFAGMWLLVVNGLFYLGYGFATGRFRRRLLPIRISDLLETIGETLRFHLSHEDLTHYNAVQKLLYIIVITAGVMQVVTGVAIWKPVQFSWLTALFGGFQGARLAHFLGMSVIVGFLVVHVILALLIPQTLWAMVAGGPKVEES